MIFGKYIGPIAKLKGKTALLIPEAPGFYKAQFDDLKSLPEVFTHCWRVYKKDNFKTWTSKASF